MLSPTVATRPAISTLVPGAGDVPLIHPAALREERPDLLEHIHLPEKWIHRAADKEAWGIVAIRYGSDIAVIDRSWPTRAADEEQMSEPLCLLLDGEPMIGIGNSHGNTLVMQIDGEHSLILDCPKDSRFWPEVVGRVVARVEATTFSRGGRRSKRAEAIQRYQAQHQLRRPSRRSQGI